MTRKLSILLIILSVFSCVKKEKSETIENLVLFGYSGFCFKDSANWIFDSTKLDIREYFEFKKDSFIRTARRDYIKPVEYHSVNKTDTIGLYKLMESILVNHNFNKEYLPKELELYDGRYYTLYVKTSNKEYRINYSPNCLTDSLNLLHKYITKIVLSKNLGIENEFEFSGITPKVAKELFIQYPPPPKPTSAIFQAAKR